MPVTYTYIGEYADKVSFPPVFLPNCGYLLLKLQTMAKQRIRLTESQLNMVIKESVRRTLNEGFQRVDSGSNNWYINHENAKYADLQDLKQAIDNIISCKNSLIEVYEMIENHITMEDKESRIKTPDQSSEYKTIEEITTILGMLGNIHDNLSYWRSALKEAPID